MGCVANLAKARKCWRLNSHFADHPKMDVLRQFTLRAVHVYRNHLGAFKLRHDRHVSKGLGAEVDLTSSKIAKADWCNVSLLGGSFPATPISGTIFNKEVFFEHKNRPLQLLKNKGF